MNGHIASQRAGGVAFHTFALMNSSSAKCALKHIMCRTKIWGIHEKWKRKQTGHDNQKDIVVLLSPSVELLTTS